MTGRLLVAVMLFSLFAGNSAALTFAPGGTAPPEMTGLRSVVIWDGHTEHLIIQARFKHAAGRVALVIPLAGKASNDVGVEDPAVFHALTGYLAARSAADDIEEWPAGEANLVNTYRQVMKGAGARDWLEQNGFSAHSLQDDKTYAVIAYDIPDEVAGSADELVTELLHFSLTVPHPHLPVAGCGSLVHFYSSQPVADWPEGIEPACVEETPYYWSRMLSRELSPVRKLFTKYEELKNVQCRFHLVKGAGSGDIRLHAVPAMSRERPPEAATLRAELAQLSGIREARGFADGTKNMKADELQVLAEALEARAEMLRRFIYEKNPPSGTVEKFWSILKNATLQDDDTPEAAEARAKLVVENLGKLFSDECWAEKMEPIVGRKGNIDFVREGHGNATSYDWAVISEVIGRGGAVLIVEMSQRVGKDEAKRGIFSRQKYTLKYVGRTWLITDIEQIE